MTKKEKWLLAAVVVLAIFFRFYKIVSNDCGTFEVPQSCHLVANMPGGLFPDEAANGLDINLMQQGHLQPFYERGNGREALFFYMEWASTAIFGKGVWQFHIVSALIGVLAVFAAFLVARRLFLLGEDESDEQARRRSVAIALLASFFLAVSSWHTVLSRTALRANMTPLFGALTLYLLIWTYQAKERKNQLKLAILTGITFALGFYTYIAFRIMAPIMFMILIWPLLAAIKRQNLRETVQKYFKPFILFLLAFIIFILPLANYFYHHFDYFIGRSGQVSVFNPELYLVNDQQLHGKPPLKVVLSVVGQVTKTAVAGFFTEGDLNWRQNISGYPLLSPLISPFFGAGLIVISLLGVWYFFAPSKKAKYWKYYLLTGWFWGMLLPEISTAEGIPHGLRSAGIIAPTFIIAAVAVYQFAKIAALWHKKIWAYARARYGAPNRVAMEHHEELATLALKLVAVVFVSGLVVQTYFLYFVYAANSPEYFYAFRSDLTPVSEYLNRHCQDVMANSGLSSKISTFLILDKYSVQTTDYLTSNPKGNFSNPCNVPYLQVDPENAWKLPPLKAGQEAVFTQSSVFDTKKFKEHHPEAHLILEVRNKFGQSVLAVYQKQ